MASSHWVRLARAQAAHSWGVGCRGAGVREVKGCGRQEVKEVEEGRRWSAGSGGGVGGGGVEEEVPGTLECGGRRGGL